MYFTEKKKERAMETLRICYSCAEEAGMRDALFVNFGLLLGIVREGDFIAHDDDVDMCVLMDKITPIQQLRYFNLLKKHELFFARERKSIVTIPDGYSKSLLSSNNAVDPTTVFMTWFSLRKRKGYPKFCHWFMIPWKGYYWHTKAGMWVSRKKFDPRRFNYEPTDDAILKGVPEDHLKELMEIEFRGLKINIPTRFGSVLDSCYPGWLIPKIGGASAKETVCIAKDWNDKRTWKVISKPVS